MNFRILTLAALMVLTPLTAAKAITVFQADEMLSVEVDVAEPSPELEAAASHVKTAAVVPWESIQSSADAQSGAARLDGVRTGAISLWGGQANTASSLTTDPDFQAEIQANIAQFRAVAAVSVDAARGQPDNSAQSSVASFETVVEATSAFIPVLANVEGWESAPLGQGNPTNAAAAKFGKIGAMGEAVGTGEKDIQILAGGGGSRRRRKGRSYRRRRRGYYPYGFYPGGGIYLRFGGSHHGGIRGGFYPSFGLHHGFPYGGYRRNYFPYSRYRRNHYPYSRYRQNYYPFSRYRRIYFPYGRHRYRSPY